LVDLKVKNSDKETAKGKNQEKRTDSGGRGVKKRLKPLITWPEKESRNSSICTKGKGYKCRLSISLLGGGIKVSEVRSVGEWGCSCKIRDCRGETKEERN